MHVAFIMDGNGRWATRRLRPRAYGHKMGVQNMFRICGHAFHLGVRIVTVFALSAENLSRPQAELDELYELFRTFFDKKKEKLLELNAKIHVIGDLAALPYRRNIRSRRRKIAPRRNYYGRRTVP